MKWGLMRRSILRHLGVLAAALLWLCLFAAPAAADHESRDLMEEIDAAFPEGRSHSL